MSAIEPGAAVTILVDGRAVSAHKGQTIAAALLSAGIRTLRHTRSLGRPRGLYCGMGVCFDCIASIDGVVERTCMRRVEEGMRIESLARFGSPRELP